jgi:hypothetical protein
MRWSEPFRTRAECGHTGKAVNSCPLAFPQERRRCGQQVEHRIWAHETLNILTLSIFKKESRSKKRQSCSLVTRGRVRTHTGHGVSIGRVLGFFNYFHLQTRKIGIYKTEFHVQKRSFSFPTKYSFWKFSFEVYRLLQLSSFFFSDWKAIRFV